MAEGTLSEILAVARFLIQIVIIIWFMKKQPSLRKLNENEEPRSCL